MKERSPGLGGVGLFFVFCHIYDLGETFGLMTE